VLVFHFHFRFFLSGPPLFWFLVTFLSHSVWHPTCKAFSKEISDSDVLVLGVIKLSACFLVEHIYVDTLAPSVLGARCSHVRVVHAGAPSDKYPVAKLVAHHAAVPLLWLYLGSNAGVGAAIRVGALG